MGRTSKSLAVITVLIVVLVIVFLMEPLAQFGTVEAQYPFCNPAIEIDSPQPEAVYNTTSIPIEIVVLPWETGERFVDIYYTIRRRSQHTIKHNDVSRNNQSIWIRNFR